MAKREEPGAGAHQIRIASIHRGSDRGMQGRRSGEWGEARSQRNETERHRSEKNGCRLAWVSERVLVASKPGNAGGTRSTQRQVGWQKLLPLGHGGEGVSGGEFLWL